MVEKEVNYPSISKEIPQEILKWIVQYGITYKEIEDNGWGYSSNTHSLAMPSYLGDDRVGIQYRHFGESKRKYTIQGNKLRMSRASLRRTLPSPFPECLVFVEDIVSCVKVRRQFNCICLYGCTIPLELIITYLEAFKTFRIWLDPDKKKEAVKQCLNLKQKGIDISPIFSEDDPKALTDEQIRSKLL